MDINNLSGWYTTTLDDATCDSHHYVLNLVFSKFMRQISLSDCKISKTKCRQHIGLQTELKVIQSKIDGIFLKNQDGGHFINGVHVTFPL